MTAMLLGVAIVAIVVALIAAYCSLLDSIYKERLATDEVYMVTTQDLWKIRVCRYRKGRTSGQPVLLVHGASANQHNFTSPRGTSLVDYLVDRGFDCWTVDLRGCRSSEAPFERHRNQITTDDYLNDDIPTLIRFVRQETGYAKIHYCGHSMGGMLLYAYVLKYGGGDIASAATLGSPLGFEGVKSARPRTMVRLLALCPPLVGALARAAVPIVLAFRITTPFFPINMRNLAKGMGAEDLYTMLEDPLPGVLGDLSRWVSTPGWTMDGGKLDVLDGLRTIDIPLLAIYAQNDPFVSLDRARAFVDDLASTDKRMLVCSREQGFKRDYGHCDLAFGLEGPREVFAPIARWFDMHATSERMPLVEPEVATGYQAPLKASERVDILSGDSYAHLAPAPPVPGAAAEVPVVVAEGQIGLEAQPAPAIDEPVSTGKKRAARKKPASRRKSAVKKKAAATPKPAARKKPAAKAKPAPETGAKAKTKAPTEPPKGPDLASVSAALRALRPAAPRPAAPQAEAPITVTPARDSKVAPARDEAAETPASVLKALSNASSALELFNKSSQPGDRPPEDSSRG